MISPFSRQGHRGTEDFNNLLMVAWVSLPSSSVRKPVTVESGIVSACLLSVSVKPQTETPDKNKAPNILFLET